LPDDWTLQNPKKIERNFFFGILISLAPQFMETVVLDIRSQRINQQAGRVIKPQAINVTGDWVEHLLAQPFISGRYMCISISSPEAS